VHRVVEGVFTSQMGPQSHEFVGTALNDVVMEALPDVDGAAKHPFLPVAILAVGADGYSATVAWAEIAPSMTATPALIAYTEDAHPLDQPDSSFLATLRAHDTSTTWSNCG
jgi:hypothetical protein